MEPDQTALLMAFGSEVSIRVEYFSEVIIGNGRGCGTVTFSREFAKKRKFVCVGKRGACNIEGEEINLGSASKPREAENLHIFETPPRKFGDP